MAEPSKDTDQSMEDILQSIKRIIADEGDVPPPAAGSDVLELTELLAEDADTSKLLDEAPASANGSSIASMSIEEIMNAPTSSEMIPTEPTGTPTMTPKEEPIPVAAPEPALASTPVPAAPAAPAPAPTAGLMSDSTLSASLAALNALSHQPAAVAPAAPSTLAFRSGTTVEDLVVEALKPMLKEWLDGNLPSMVTALVEKEIRRLSSH